MVVAGFMTNTCLCALRKTNWVRYFVPWSAEIWTKYPWIWGAKITPYAIRANSPRTAILGKINIWRKKRWILPITHFIWENVAKEQPMYQEKDNPEWGYVCGIPRCLRPAVVPLAPCWFAQLPKKQVEMLCKKMKRVHETVWSLCRVSMAPCGTHAHTSFSHCHGRHH